jgi:hypothetical protein
VTDTRNRAAGFAAAAAESIRVGNRDQALRWVELAEDAARAEVGREEQGVGAVELAKAVATAGRLVAARTLAQSIAEPGMRTAALQSIAAEAAGAHNMELANEIIDSLSDDGDRALAVGWAAAAAAAAGNSAPSSALVDAINDHSSWIFKDWWTKHYEPGRLDPITAVVDRDLGYVAAGHGCRRAGASGWPDKLVSQAWNRGKVGAAAVIMPVCGTDQSRGSRCCHGRP